MVTQTTLSSGWRDWIASRTIAYIGLAVAAVAAGVMTWQAFAYRGLFAYLAEWQFERFDSMFPVATVVFVTALLAAPFALLVWLRLRRQRQLYGKPDRARLARRDAWLAAGLKWAAALFVLVAATAAVFGVATTMTWDKPMIGLTLAPDARPTQGLVAARGTVLIDRVGRYRESFLVAKRDLYVAPLVVGDSDQRLQYFVELSGPDAASMPDGEIKGVLREAALPGALERLYRNAGYRIEHPTYVIFRDAASARWPFLSAAAECALLALLFASGWLLMRRHVRGLSRKAEPR